MYFPQNCALSCLSTLGCRSPILVTSSHHTKASVVSNHMLSGWCLSLPNTQPTAGQRKQRLDCEKLIKWIKWVYRGKNCEGRNIINPSKQTFSTWLTGVMFSYIYLTLVLPYLFYVTGPLLLEKVFVHHHCLHKYCRTAETFRKILVLINQHFTMYTSQHRYKFHYFLTFILYRPKTQHNLSELCHSANDRAWSFHQKYL